MTPRRSTPPVVTVRRVYDPPGPQDGYRVLVDRVWPRGLKKADAHLDEWCRDIAPSTELRKWYGHDPQLFDAFRERYLRELEDAEHAPSLAHLRSLTGAPLTLLTATKAAQISQARVLADLLGA